MTLFKRLINNDLYTNLYICLVLSKQVVNRYMRTEAGQSGPNKKVDQNAQGDGETPPNAARQEWLSLLATADADQLAVLWSATGLAPAHRMLRQPEIGAVMVRGRAGSTGDAFNLGEMTVTRASLRLDDGCVGHGWCQGRCKTQATTIALVDALMQGDHANQLEAAVLAPLREAREGRHAARAAKAAATKVDFFTMARGED